jgi:6-pyruvoyltetrahydropterin/6-carboxytetrahydropterin synthase
MEEMNKVHKLTAIRTIGLDAGHRLVGHGGKCAHFHGHRYTFDFWYSSEKSDYKGDVEELHDYITTWMMDHWDHGMILNSCDPYATAWAPGGLFEGQKYYLLQANPSAENLASFMLEQGNRFAKQEDLKLTIIKVICWETPNCSAEASLQS